MRTLSDVATVYLGFKSLLNDFFYVDEATVTHFGIEDEFLEPIFKLKDLDELSYRQITEATRWVFRCQLEGADLRGTGASRYIQWGAQQETRLRKQAKGVVKWPEAPALRHSRHWYWPAAPLHPVRIAIRKAIDQRYAPFLFDEPTVLDQRLYLLIPVPPISVELLAAYCASSLLPWALEVDADLALGAGALTLGAKNLRKLPVLDIVSVVGTHREGQILEAANGLYQEIPPEASTLASTAAQRTLDEAWLKATNNDPAHAEAMVNEVSSLAERRQRVASRRRRVRRELSQADIERVAEPLAERLERWLGARQIPEDFFDPESSLQSITFPNTDLEVQLEMMLGNCDLRVIASNSGQVLLEENTIAPRAELILRCLQLGRRTFRLPTDAGECYLALDQLDAFVDSFEDQIRQTVSAAPIGPRHEELIHRVLFARHRIPISELRRPADTGTYFSRSHSR